MGKKKRHKKSGKEAMPTEESATESVEIPEIIETEGPTLDSVSDEQGDAGRVDEPVDGETAGEPSLPETGDLAEQMTQLERETHELKETLLRKMAEFENLKKRTAREKEEAVRYGTAEILNRLLEVLDNFDRALLLSPESEGFDIHSFYEGMKLIARHLGEILKGEGLVEINPEGDPFDPFYHEAMMREESTDFPDNTVVEVFQKGYKLKDRLLRPARVKVAVHPRDTNTGEAESDNENGDEALEENES